MARTWIVVALAGVIGSAGCTATLEGLAEDLKNANEVLAAPKQALSGTTVDVIGASGGHQVRNVSVTVPDLSCSGRTYAEVRDAFLAGFKGRYIKTWNDAIASHSPAATLAKTAKQKQRLAYFQSKEIKPTDDIHDAMHKYDTKQARVMMERSPRDANPADREAYMKASCVRSAYHKGGSKGIDQAQDDIRQVIDRAPPDT